MHGAASTHLRLWRGSARYHQSYHQPPPRALHRQVLGMKPGGVRRIIVPVELGYPDNDYNKLGPKPTTFSGA